MDGLHFTVIVLWRHGQTPSLSRWRFDISAGDRCARNFLLYLRRLAQLRPLLDVVDQREQLPLPIDFVPTAQREAVEPLVVADVAEHRLDRRETSAIFFSTERAVDARTHVLRVRVAGPACQHGDLSRLGRVGFAPTNLYRAIARSLAHLHPTEQDRGQFFYGFVRPHDGRSSEGG